MEFINKVVTALKERVITVNQQIINERTPAERELIVKAIHDCCATKALMSETMIEKVIAFAIAKKVKEETIAASVTSLALLEMYTDSVNIYKYGIMKATAYRAARGVMYKAVTRNSPKFLSV